MSLEDNNFQTDYDSSAGCNRNKRRLKTIFNKDLVSRNRMYCGKQKKMQPEINSEHACDTAAAIFENKSKKIQCFRCYGFNHIADNCLAPFPASYYENIDGFYYENDGFTRSRGTKWKTKLPVLSHYQKGRSKLKSKYSYRRSDKRQFQEELKTSKKNEEVIETSDKDNKILDGFQGNQRNSSTKNSENQKDSTDKPTNKELVFKKNETNSKVTQNKETKKERNSFLA